MSWPSPSDPYYLYNTSEANSRRTYYNITGVPAGIVGGTDGGWPWDPNWSNAILNRTSVAPQVDIAVTGYYDDVSREGSITIGVTPIGAVAGSRVLHMALVENDLYYEPSYQTYDTHHNVMRDMIPSASGTPITLSTGSTETVDLDFSVPELVVVENAKLVIFVQNSSTKNVMNTYAVPVLSILADCLNETGDIIDFGAINVQDLVKLVGIIIGTDTGSDYCQLAAADMNEDGQINVQDIVLLVELILG
jgi:hypothetical protein